MDKKVSKRTSKLGLDKEEKKKVVKSKPRAKPVQKEDLKPLKVISKAPPPTIDYTIKLEKGLFDPDHPFWRCSSDVPGCENGFGQTQPKAIEDFIRRNPSNILNKIFDLKCKEES